MLTSLERSTDPSAVPAPAARPTVRGKFLCVGEETLWCKGVSYGTFRIGPDGREELEPARVASDLAQIASRGFNVVRVNTCPPRWFLDVAARHGLRVMVVLSWGESMAVLDEPGRERAIERALRGWVRPLSGHPALLAYLIGNEVPASLVRWYGPSRVERFLYRLYRAVKDEDPEALVSYVNYPSAEYLRLPFLDFVSFNVYLEDPEAFASYLARLHSLSDDRPVLLAEIGMDSQRNGTIRQADTLSGQVRAAFRGGAAGVVVFAWTDEWYHGTHPVNDWAFGLTTWSREPRPALAAVERALAETPFPPYREWPVVSVVVCTYNGAATLAETLEHVARLDYPHFEVLVVDDGSTDATREIASRYPARLIPSDHRGLSHARNVGLREARGAIVAYLDDDAYPDRNWLRYLALAFEDESVDGAGGPNLPPPGDGRVASAVANSPGGPNPVLLSDRVAEHLAGCNMAFRRSALEAIGGFDPRFRAAGDDVDLCWRLRDAGLRLAYAPAAFVWHHRRGSVRRFWRQQVGYGKAEALLAEKWPARFDLRRQARWSGRIYGRGVPIDLMQLRPRVYHGVWGTAAFQSLYQRRGSLWGITQSPEWFLALAAVAGLSLLNLGWVGGPVLGAAFIGGAAVTVGQAGVNAARAVAQPPGPRRAARRAGDLALVWGLHLMQPLARLRGRLSGGLVPLRSWSAAPPDYRLARRRSMWRERREPVEETLGRIEQRLHALGRGVRRGSAYDAWDIEVPGGSLGGSRLLVAVEEHAPGKQRLHFRVTPAFPLLAPTLVGALTALCVGAAGAGAPVAAASCGVVGVAVVVEALRESAAANGLLRDALTWIGCPPPPAALRRGRARSIDRMTERPAGAGRAS